MVCAEYGDIRLSKRFWDKVSPEPNSGCWLWTAAVDPNGYGKFGVPGQYRTALSHRYSFENLVERADDCFVCHKCDNPSCVNPYHLFLGDQKDNMRDMSNKGRHKLNNIPLQNKQKTHCVRGHLLSGSHVRIWKGGRYCNICHAMHQQAYLARKGIEK